MYARGVRVCVCVRAYVYVCVWIGVEKDVKIIVCMWLFSI